MLRKPIPRGSINHKIVFVDKISTIYFLMSPTKQPGHYVDEKSKSNIENLRILWYNNYDVIILAILLLMSF